MIPRLELHDTVRHRVAKYFAAIRSIRPINRRPREKADRGDAISSACGFSFIGKRARREIRMNVAAEVGTLDYTERATHINKLVFTDVHLPSVVVRLLP